MEPIDNVVYVQCPHCKKGWFGELISYDVEWDYKDSYIVKHFLIQGINPTELTEPIHCLNCHKEYTPLAKTIKPPFKPEWPSIEMFSFQPKDCRVMEMWRFVAELLTTCRGH